MAYAILNGIPGGHWLILEQADTFNRALIRFLKSVRSK
jgi:pimeloyl-ACP methyl ester carboxylesterase